MQENPADLLQQYHALIHESELRHSEMMRIAADADADAAAFRAAAASVNEVSLRLTELRGALKALGVTFKLD